jgi:hypothetical protein
MKIGGVTGWLRAVSPAEGVPVSSHLFSGISAHLLAITRPATGWSSSTWRAPS